MHLDTAKASNLKYQRLVDHFRQQLADGSLGPGDQLPSFAEMRAKGQGVGALMDMKTSFTLSDAGEGTSMAWEADVKIAGPVGAMGQRVLQPIVNQQVTQVLEALEARVSAAASEGGAEQGIHPASPEAYDAEPEGPTHSTTDS